MEIKIRKWNNNILQTRTPLPNGKALLRMDFRKGRGRI